MQSPRRTTAGLGDSHSWEKLTSRCEVRDPLLAEACLYSRMRVIRAGLLWVFGICIAAFAIPAAGADRVPVIFDTDIGTDIDDAYALAALLARPDLELLGVT